MDSSPYFSSKTPTKSVAVWSGAAALVVASLELPSPASAEPTTADRATARSLMAEARADRERGDLTHASEAFAAADALMHVSTTGLELARTQAAMGRLVDAADKALRVTRLPDGPNDPVPFRRAHEAASELYE